MGKLDLTSILAAMLDAAKTSLEENWPSVSKFAGSSFRTLAQTLVDIEEMTHEGVISQEQARLLLSMHKNTTKIVLLSVELVGLVKAEAALNAALNAIKIPVNAAIGFPIV
jgi:hypothetical protein